MSQFRLSQLDPLPEINGIKTLNTVGQGSFAMVKVAYQESQPKKLFAVKFIHRKICHRRGLGDDDIGKEVYLHKECSGHPNIIQLYFVGSSDIWMYIGLELATGGDLFDKIEPDVGLDDTLSHFYFCQLINAVDFVHSKGVAHRDIKPENILLDQKGNLKLADFGLATVFRKHDGPKRVCRTPCGSPPYVAPEIVNPQGYDPELTDVWSCGIVLFVIACGELPWEEPTDKDVDFKRFRLQNGKVLSEGWNRLSLPTLQFLRFLLQISPEHRPNIKKIRKHVWVNKSNQYSTDDGLCKDTAALTAKLLEKLHIGLLDSNFEESSSQDKYDSVQDYFTTSQPVTDIAAMINDEEDDEFLRNMPATQQIFTEKNRYLLDEQITTERETIIKIMSKDPAALQFSNNFRNNQVNYETLFNINVTGRLTRFFSILPTESIIPTITSSLNRVGVSTSGFDDRNISDRSLSKSPVHITVHTVDRKKMVLRGEIRISRVKNLSLKSIEFIKTRGDPLEWRRFFKRITVLSRDLVYIEN